MSRHHRRHALAGSAALFAVIALTAVVATAGFRDFGSAFWLLNASHVAVLAYVLVLLAARALAREHGVWKRAAAFGAACGSAVTVLAFARLADLNVSGVVVALALTGTLGAALGLVAVEGLRWVRGGSASGEAV